VWQRAKKFWPSEDGNVILKASNHILIFTPSIPGAFD